MKKVLVLCSVNDSPEYLSAVEGASRCWNSISNSDITFEFKVIHVNKGFNRFPNKVMLKVEEFDVPGDINSVFASQMLRILCADQFDYDGVLITDVDILPLDPWYFINPILSTEPSKFLVFRNVISEEHQYPICYLYANPQIWRIVLGEDKPIHRLRNHWDQVNRTEYKSQRGSISWTYDQRWIFSRLNSPVCKDMVDFPYPMDENFARLDRVNLSSRLSWFFILTKRYTDYHRKLPVKFFGKFTEVVIRCKITFLLKYKHD
jgi:hypothetical protein